MLIMRKCLNGRVKNILNAFLLNERADQKTESTALKRKDNLTQATTWMNLGGAKGNKPITKGQTLPDSAHMRYLEELKS